MVDVLACTVRGCGHRLVVQGRTMVCANRHSYDIARSGYVNLLQPHDRRSRAAGDSRQAIDARARLHAAGVGRTLIDAIVQRVATLPSSPAPVIVELGCGTGDLLAAIADNRRADAVGIDLSVPAVEHASRRFPALTWVVANADRRLPLIDASVDVMVSMHARRNPAECARALRPSGHLLVVVPAPDDLVELRATVQGAGVDRDRAAGVIAEHQEHFRVIERAVVHERGMRTRDVLHDLLRGSYRGARASAAQRVDTLDEMEVTLASELVLLARSSTGK